jgi:hypothetical protein
VFRSLPKTAQPLIDFEVKDLMDSVMRSSRFNFCVFDRGLQDKSNNNLHSK